MCTRHIAFIRFLKIIEGENVIKNGKIINLSIITGVKAVSDDS